MYEYKVVQKGLWQNNSPAQWEKYLNEMGKQGWCLVDRSDWYGTITFMREVKRGTDS